MKIVSVLLTLALLSACATIPPQEPVSFARTLNPAENTIAVSISEIPKVVMTYPGANCLLCLGVAATANSGVSGVVKKIDASEFSPIGEQLTSALTEKGYSVKVLDETLKLNKLKSFKEPGTNQARKDYTPLKAKLDASHLLVLNVDYVGVKRDYASYVPTGEPYAIIEGLVYLIDLTTNTYQWYLPLNQRFSAGQEWKEPPSYPGVVNSFYQALETAKEKILTGVVAFDQNADTELQAQPDTEPSDGVGEE